MTLLVALRYDLSRLIGTGHLKRLMSIGIEMDRRQIPFRFVGTAAAATLFNEFNIPKDRAIQIDTNECETDWLNQSPQFTHVIVDVCHEHRSNAGELVQNIKKSGPHKVAVIDSLAPDHFQEKLDGIPDLIVTPYLNANLHRPTPSTPNWLYGSKFSLLNHDFRRRRLNLENSVSKLENHLLICCGGSDPENLTELILNQLIQQNTLPVRTTVVVGNLYSYNRRKSLQTLVERTGLDIDLVDGKDGIGDFLEKCTFVIARAGLIRYEAACLGKNMFLILDQTRYESYFRGFESSDLAKMFFLDQPEGKRSFIQLLKSLADREKVKQYGKFNEVAFNAVDGLGISRFLNRFLNS